ncbi:DSC-2 [Biomphalaria pfeifferi]|uniref:DSC-2 n=1 Tax=Biomphalaria pfeifferi TaxID=112525 RepID=A0AAD8B8T1_BIOPF|nr:DSC-2 [Biomphalaria pfeifferi]
MEELSLLLLTLIFGASFGSNELSTVKLQAKPGTIHPILSKVLELRCSVQNNNWESLDQSKTAPTIQHFTSQQSSWNDTVNSFDDSKLESSSSQGQAEFSRLLTLVVSKVNKESGENETIASVTGCDTPVIENKFVSTLQVAGSTEGSPVEGEQGYLTLTWDSPVEKHGGYFICEAFALNSNKHPVSLSASLQINAVQPQISDVVNYISTLDKYVLDLKAKVTELQKGQNTQTGKFQCYSTTSVDFHLPFNNTPKVILSPSSISWDYSEYSTYSISIESVSNTGFEVLCSYPRQSMEIMWLAIV